MLHVKFKSQHWHDPLLLKMWLYTVTVLINFHNVEIEILIPKQKQKKQKKKNLESLVLSMSKIRTVHLRRVTFHTHPRIIFTLSFSHFETGGLPSSPNTVSLWKDQGLSPPHSGELITVTVVPSDSSVLTYLILRSRLEKTRSQWVHDQVNSLPLRHYLKFSNLVSFSPLGLLWGSVSCLNFFRLVDLQLFLSLPRIYPVLFLDFNLTLVANI